MGQEAGALFHASDEGRATPGLLVSLQTQCPAPLSLCIAPGVQDPPLTGELMQEPAGKAKLVFAS